MDSEANERREIVEAEHKKGGGGEGEGLQEESEIVNSYYSVPEWKKQITLRGVIVSSLIGGIYSFMVLKQGLTTGIIPNLTLSTALFAYLFTSGWTKVLNKFGIVVAPFTRQENTMIQTCAVACYSIAVGGGLWSSLLGLDKKTYEKTGIDTPGNSPGSYKDPGMVWMTAFLLVTSFIGIFVLIPLTKILIIDYKLTFPSGMATAVLINGFHNRGNKMAKKQVGGFMKFVSMSFFWGFFQWFYTGDPGCGFSHFPTLGLQAWKHSFYFDFSMTMVGTGMLLPHMVNLSTLFGAVLSWGFLWPVLRKLKGKWYPADLPETSMKSLNGYMIFISIALLLGDGMYNFIKIIFVTFLSIHQRFKNKGNYNLEEEAAAAITSQNKASQMFTRETIPTSLGVSGYILFAVTSAVAVPLMFPAVRWYHVMIMYMLTPVLAFCNAYGAGLTDINMAYSYSKVGLFAMAAVGGEENGVVAGLVGCGIIKSVISVSCILMQDMKTGHLTLTSPRAMLASQAIGTAIGCVVCPLIFILFYNTFDVGNPNGDYKAPYALIYRNIAILGVEGVSALPRHCLQLCSGFFSFAIGINLVKDLGPPKLGKWLPMPVAMAVTFPVGAYFAIDLFVGSLVVFIWEKLRPHRIDFMVQAVASGLICGEGLWILPATLLSLAKINPPMCMKFMPS